MKCSNCGIELKPNKIKEGWESLYNITSQGIFCNKHYKEARLKDFDKYPKVRTFGLINPTLPKLFNEPIFS